MNESTISSCGCCKSEVDDSTITKAPRWQTSKRLRWVLLGIAGIAAVSSEVVLLLLGDGHPLIIGLALFAVAVGGLRTYRKGLVAIKNLDMNMNALMSIAATGAMFINQWPEAAMVMVLFALAEEIETWSLSHAKRSVRELMTAAPSIARVKMQNGEWQDIHVSKVELAATVLIRPGERIPLDGILVSGYSMVNQAPITGESLPVNKQPGDQTFAGTINENGAFEYKVTALAEDSQLSHIIKLVEEAQSQRAPTQRFVDQFARIYTPTILGVALLIATLPPLMFAMPFAEWLYRALVLLVIACPCALVISTPVTIVSGLAAAARQGFLVKGGAVLEIGRKIRALALDKTGTITYGKPKVTMISALSTASDELRCQWLAATLAQSSDHPVSVAISASWKDARIKRPLAQVEDFENMGGRGVKARIAGKKYFLANRRLAEELGIVSSHLDTLLTRFDRQGQTTVILATPEKALGVFVLEDTVKESARRAIAELISLKIHPVILSGDNTPTVRAIGDKVGISDARGNLLPGEKLNAVTKLMEKYTVVGMAGDGFNDAPALAGSSIGFAMAAVGSDAAIETADVALMDDDLRKIPRFIRLSSATHKILIQNFALAIGIKALFLTLAVLGLATLWMAVFADVGASLIVIFNGLRMIRFFKS